MIEFKNVCKKYSNLKALDNINLTIPSSSIFGIVGKSGAGKSTLLRTINKLEKIDEGSIIVDGIDIVTLNLRQLREFRKKVAMIFQHFSLMQTKTIYKNIALPLECSGYKKSEIKTKVEELASLVGISDKLNEKPRNLSGGQCQRVAIARALVNDPEILLADEPTGALDTVTSVQIMDLIKEISKEKLVIMVTHNPELAEKYSTRIVRLLDGIINDDSNPCSDEEEEKELTRNDDLEVTEKAKMSFWTAFKLSSRNLLSKFKRTLMVGLAGSIGIIGCV